MNFAFSEEQEELRRAVRQFLESKSPETEVRRLMETTEGYDPAVWKQMGQELMLQGLAIPEEYGGQGFTFIELGIVLEEMGRVLLCAPYFSSVVLAANAILAAGTDAEKQALLPGHRVGRHDRRAGVHRAVGQVGRGRHHDGSEGERRRRVHADRREDVRDRRLHGRHDRRRRPPRGHDRDRRHLVLHGRRRRRRSHAHAAPDDGHDAQAGEARVRQRRRDAARQHARAASPRSRRCSTRPRSRSPTR